MLASPLEKMKVWFLSPFCFACFLLKAHSFMEVTNTSLAVA